MPAKKETAIIPDVGSMTGAYDAAPVSAVDQDKADLLDFLNEATASTDGVIRMKARKLWARINEANG